MPRIKLNNEFQLETRNQYTKVDCEMTIMVDGRELPSMAVLGKTFETAIELVQAQIKESYQAVPERVS
jgi:hypothetical protein